MSYVEKSDHAHAPTVIGYTVIEWKCPFCSFYNQEFGPVYIGNTFECEDCEEHVRLGSIE